MTECDGAAVRVDVRRIVRQAELAQDRERLRGEGLVELHDVRCRVVPSPSRASSLRVAGTGPMPMIRGRDAGDGGAGDACTWREPVAVCRRGARDEHGRRAVVDGPRRCRP